MNTFTTTATVVRGAHDCTINGLTSRFDTLPLIFVGDYFDGKPSKQEAAAQAFADELGHTDFLVARDRGQYGWSITPAAHFLRQQRGNACFGGNSVEVNGEVMKCHDRVESWELYDALSR